MNDIQEIIYWSAKEATGLWDIITELSNVKQISRSVAIDIFKSEIEFIKSNQDIFLLKSDKLYDNNTIQVLDKSYILNLKLSDYEFNQNGSFYYLSDCELV